MPYSRPPQPVFTRDRILATVLAILTALILYVCYRIAEPFIPSMAFAMALAVATHGPFRWLRRRLRNGTVAAAVGVVLVAILIIGPAAFLTTYIVQMAVENAGEIQRGGGLNRLRETLERQPYIGPLVLDFTSHFRLDEQIANLGQALGSRAGRVLSGSIEVVTQLAVTLFVLFFLYRDCGQALNAVRNLLPLSEAEAGRLFERVASTISATVNGSLAVAAIQATLAGTVYAVMGVPAAVLWAAVTFLAALVPVFGTFVVWAPIALYLALTGSLVKALFLVAWGVLVVGMVDNLLYPHFVGDKLRLHTVPTFFAVLGGIGLFGPSGLIMGPLALALAIGFLDVWWLRTQNGSGAEEAEAEEPHEETPPGAVLQQRGS